MTLGDVIKKYREEHKLSQRQFASRCDLTNGLISMIEKNESPRTGRPMVPSLTTIKKIADAVRIPLNQLLDMIDDIPVELSAEDASEAIELAKRESLFNDDNRNQTFVEMFDKLPPEKQMVIIQEMKEMMGLSQD